MKKFVRYCYRCISCILSSLLLLSTGAFCMPIAAEEASDIAVKIFQSTSRYDMGIDCSNVRLGWSITSTRRSLYQTAYHVVVTDEKGDTAWDSGWVESNAQVGIVAQDLKPETIYTAKVQIKDDKNQESAFSEGLVFETAPAELEGEWLTSKRLVRETFTLEQPLANVERARCYMSSAVLIEPRLNGSKVGDLVWNPARTVFTEMTYYNTFDVTDLLRDGENAVGAYTSTDYFISDYNLIGMLRIHYKDGSVQTVSTGEGWTTCAISEITGENALAGESIDARLVTDWDTPAFVETADWVPAASPMLRAHNGEVAIPAKADYRTLQSFSGDYSVELTATVTQRAFGLLIGAAEKEETPMMWQVVEGGLRLYWPDWIQIKTVSVPELTAGQKFTMKLDIRGNRITTYINGERVHSTAVPAGSTAGTLGVRTDDGEAALCDQLTVTQDGQVIWEDRFDTADAEKWTFPRSPEIKPAISGSRVIEEFKPVSTTEIRKDGKTSYVLDFGQNMQGVVRMDTKGKAGTSYLIEYSELVDEKTGDIWAATTYHYPKSTYTLSGGEDTFMPRFFYCGFRYVKVTASDGSAINPDDFTACFLSEDLDQTGDFASSSERLNQIYEMYLRTQKSCIIGSVYAGCPGREKVCWTGDASVTKEAVLLSMSDIHGSEACMELMWHNIQPSGAPINLMFHTKLAAEDDNWDYAWTSAYFVFPYEVYMTTGDTYYIEKNYKQMLELFDFYTKVRNTNREHIKTGRATDWLGYDNQEHLVDYSYLDTAYYYYNGKLLSEMLEVIGVDHSELDARLEEIRDAIQQAFYDERGYYHGKTQTENAMALDLGVVPAEHAEAVLNSLVNACNRANKTLRTGVLGTKSLYDALSQANQHKLLLDMTLNPKKCSFGYFLDNGATTFLEHWDVAGETFFSHNTPILAQLDSQNHVMFGGGLATWMYEGLGGITNSGAGYTESTFRPGIESGLESASASVTALVGKLSSDWRMENGDLVWSIEVPANTTATVIIPMASAKSITESGQDIFMKNGDGITYVGQNDSGDFVYTVGGGSYTFRASETPLAETDPQDTEPADTNDADTGTEETDPAGTDAPTDSSEETKASRSGCASAMGVSTLGTLGVIAAAPALMKKRAKKKA